MFLILQGTEGSIPRVKPFKYAYEKEIVLYAYFKKLDYFATECIYAPDAYRGHARALVKDLEALRPSSIIDVIHAGIGSGPIFQWNDHWSFRWANFLLLAIRAFNYLSGNLAGPFQLRFVFHLKLILFFYCEIDRGTVWCQGGCQDANAGIVYQLRLRVK